MSVSRVLFYFGMAVGLPILLLIGYWWHEPGVKVSIPERE